MLFVGNDWAEAHHDVELVDEAGRILARRRLPEGVTGLAGLHALIADHLDPDGPKGVSDLLCEGRVLIVGLGAPQKGSRNERGDPHWSGDRGRSAA